MHPKKNEYHYVVFYRSLYRQKRMSFVLVTIECIHRERIVLNNNKKTIANVKFLEILSRRKYFTAPMNTYQCLNMQNRRASVRLFCVPTWVFGYDLL
jgi:hypothetical protein